MKDDAQTTAAIRVAWITGILGCIAVVLGSAIGLGLPFIQKMADAQQPTAMVIVVIATVSQPATASIDDPIVSTQPPPLEPASGNASCEEIKGRLPENPEEIRANFGIPSDKSISLLYDICQEAPNGFIVGESPSLFTLQVPEGGCIDSYSGANFSDITVPESFGGRRAYRGTVQTTSLTYRIAGCELKP